MRIDLRSTVPIYRQIVDGIRSEIAGGVYRPGEGLPSIRGLAVELKVNQNTVHKAFGELESEGLITQRRGLGMFVTNRATRAAKTQSRRTALTALQSALTQCEAAHVSREEVIAVVVDRLPAASADEASI
jgi:GntR family transcriptional regulator